MVSRVINGYQSVINGNQCLLIINKLSMVKGYQWLSMVIGYQQVINSYQGLLMVISQLSMVINGYQELLMVMSQLSMVINGYWLSTSLQW